MQKIVFVSTYSLAEPVLKNRLKPFIDLALDREFSVVLVNPAGGNYHRSLEKNFSHQALDIPQANRGNFFIRTVRELLLARKVLGKIPKDSEVVFVTVPSMFLLFLFQGFRESLKILDVRDLTWEYLSDSSLMMRYAKKFFRVLARWKLPRFDFFSVTNNAEHEYLCEEVRVNPEKIIQCSNGITFEQFQSLAQVDYDSPSKKTRRLRLTYVGNIGFAQNLTTLVEAAKELPDVDFKIVGGGSDQARVEEVAKKVPNIDMTGRVDWEAIPAVYQQADILWAQLTPDFAGAVPSKLYEYLATGKRVIYGGLGEAVSVVSEFQDVEIVEPDNVSELVSTISKIINTQEDFQINLSNRQKIQEKYIRELSVERVYQRIFKG
jgi:glycosyltransferase involved in cell wall biosynthesis